MKKVFTLLTLALLSIGSAWADDVTIGRKLEFSTTPTEYTMVSDANATVTQLDGTDGQTGTGKDVYYKTTSATTINATCYRDKDNSNANITEYQDDAYAGFKVVLASGKKMTISQMNASVAVSQNFKYKVVLLDAGENIVYQSTDKTISDYSKTTASNVDATIKPDGGVGVVMGTFYVRLYYCYPSGSGSKYLVPLNLTVTGAIEDNVQTNYSKPSISQGDYNQAAGTYPVTLSVQNEEDGTINYTVGDAAEVTGAASGTVINVAPGTLVSAYVTGATYANSTATELTTSAAPTLATPTYTIGGYNLAKNLYTVTLAAAAGDITYTVGGGSETAYSTALTLAPGTAVTAFATQTNMTQSATLAFDVPAAPVGKTTTTPTTSGSYTNNADYNFGCITIPGACNAGQISSGSTPINGSLKARTNQGVTGGGNGFYVNVNPGYVISSISIQGCSNQTGALTCNKVYVDGVEKSFTGDKLPLAAKDGSTGTITVNGIAATSKIEFDFDEAYQAQMIITVTSQVAADFALGSLVSGFTKAFATFCAPQNFTITGATAYKAALEGTTLTLTALEGVIPANTGVIIAGEEAAAYTISYVADAATADVTSNDLTGVTVRTATSTLAGTSTLLALNSTAATFQEYTGEYFPANKAYLLTTALAREIGISFADNTATGIQNVENSSDTTVKKYIKNGRLVIKSANGEYSAAGVLIK